MLKVENLTFSYAEGQNLFENLSFSLETPGIYQLTGRSGSGKTTLFRLILGDLSPQGGSITFQNITTIVPLFQEDRLLSHLSVKKNCLLPLRKLPADVQKARVEEMLDRVLLSDAANKKVSDCSGGMKRRCALARALAFLPEEGGLLLLDEPFSGVDEETKAQILPHIKKLGEKHTVFLITHDAEEGAFLDAKPLSF